MQGTQIEATLWRELADQHYDSLAEGKVYLFSRGKVKPADKRYSAVRNEYQINLDAGWVLRVSILPGSQLVRSWQDSQGYECIGTFYTSEWLRCRMRCKCPMLPVNAAVSSGMGYPCAAGRRCHRFAPGKGMPCAPQQADKADLQPTQAHWTVRDPACAWPQVCH